MRREPQRERGQRRVDTILAAAAKVFAEAGYEAATTNEIASRAKTSIGSLYQFFPNKDAILRAIVARHRDELSALIDSLLTLDSIRLPTPALVDRVMDALAGFDATHTGFHYIFLNSQASPRLAAAATQLDAEVIERVDAGYALRYPSLEPQRRKLYATITITMIKALLSLAASTNGTTRPQVLAEAKAVLSNYLELLGSYDKAAA